MRDLDKKPGPVSALAVGVEAAAMGKPGQRLHPERDGFMAEIRRGHEAHAAGRPVAAHLARPGAARGTKCGGHWGKLTDACRPPLVRRRQNKSDVVMRASHAQKRLDPQGDGEVEARSRVLQGDAADLADAIEAVAKRVRVHAQPGRRLLLLARLAVRAPPGPQASLARP